MQRLAGWQRQKRLNSHSTHPSQLKIQDDQRDSDPALSPYQHFFLFQLKTDVTLCPQFCTLMIRQTVLWDPIFPLWLVVERTTGTLLFTAHAQYYRFTQLRSAFLPVRGGESKIQKGNTRKSPCIQRRLRFRNFGGKHQTTSPGCFPGRQSACIFVVLRV